MQAQTQSQSVCWMENRVREKTADWVIDGYRYPPSGLSDTGKVQEDI